MAQVHPAMRTKAHHCARLWHMATDILPIGLIPPGVRIAKQLNARRLPCIRHAFHIRQCVAVIAGIGAGRDPGGSCDGAVWCELRDQRQHCRKAPAGPRIDSCFDPRHEQSIEPDVVKAARSDKVNGV